MLFSLIFDLWKSNHPLCDLVFGYPIVLIIILSEPMAYLIIGFNLLQ